MEIERLRRERWTGVRIAQQLGLSPATVSRVLRRLKLNRVRDLEPRPVVVRYEHASAGDLVHLDIKRLVRIQRVLLRHRLDDLVRATHLYRPLRLLLLLSPGVWAARRRAGSRGENLRLVMVAANE